MKCPHCFRSLPATVQMLSCRSCPKTRPSQQNKDNGGFDLEVRPAFQAARGTCPQCAVPSTTEACPVCWNEVPSIWRADPPPDVTCIAMAGSRDTAKSVYLGVLKPQLELYLESIGKRLKPLIDTEERWWDRYGERIWERRQKVESTRSLTTEPQLAEPLVWTFTDLQGMTRVLAVRDIDGEDVQRLRFPPKGEPEEEMDRRKDRLRFMARADAIVMLIDPRQIPEVNEVLKNRIKRKVEGLDGVEILGQLLEFLAETEQEGGGATSIAVTLSMFDLFQMLRDFDSPLRPVMSRPGSPLRRDPSMQRKRDERDTDLLHLEVQSLLKSVMGDQLDNLLEEYGFPRHYFAVAPLGAEVKGQDINPVGIMPFRLLDPVRWAMKL